MLLFNERIITDSSLPIANIMLPNIIESALLITVNADSIPETWRVAGWLYKKRNDLQNVTVDSMTVLLGRKYLINWYSNNEPYKIEYEPAKWFLWQDVTIELDE